MQSLPYAGSAQSFFVLQTYPLNALSPRLLRNTTSGHPQFSNFGKWQPHVWSSWCVTLCFGSWLRVCRHRLPSRRHVSTRRLVAELDHELKLAIEAVEVACTLTRSVQATIGSVDAQSKMDASPVTVADYGAQALVADVLARSLGDSVSLVAEESSKELLVSDPGGFVVEEITRLVNAAGYTTRKDAMTSAELLAAIDRGLGEGGSLGNHWILDPIDGTKGFLRGEQYAVGLALLHNGRVVLGVLGCPNLAVQGVQDSDREGSVFFASRSGGAWVARCGAHGADALRVLADTSAMPNKARYTESHGTSLVSAHAVTAEVARLMGMRQPPLQMDSMAKYAAIACGQAHLYMRFRPEKYREKVWDHAAGCVIAEEAGCVVSDCDGQALDFGNGRWLDVSGGVIAAPPLLHAKAREAVDQINLPARPART